MVTVARQLWLQRNKVVSGGEFLSPAALVCLAKDQVQACDIAAQRTNEPRTTQRKQLEGRWTKPPKGSVKVNWDAVVDKLNGKIGMGIMARDHGGGVVARQVTGFAESYT